MKTDLEPKAQSRGTVKAAFRASIPIFAGFLVLGIAYGILMTKHGFGPGWTLLCSTFVYGGSLQFVLVDLLTRGASLLSAALMTILLHARHILYGVSMLTKYRDMGKIKPYLVLSLTDETYALVCSGAPAGTNEKLYYFCVSLFNHIYWVAGSLIGALVGNILPFNTAGIDFAMTALFLVIFVDQWRNTNDHFPALAGLGAAAACLVVFGPQNFLIPAMLVLVALLGAKGAAERRHAA